MDETLYEIQLANTSIVEFDEILESSLGNALLAEANRVMLNLSCNNHVDARTVKSILSRPEINGSANISVDVSMSGISPSDLCLLLLDERISTLIATGVNCDTDSALNMALQTPRTNPITVDLQWNCIIRSILEAKTQLKRKDVAILDDYMGQSSSTAPVNLIVSHQFKTFTKPISFPRTSSRYGLKDDLLMEEFLKEVEGFAWTDLVLHPDSVPIGKRADAVIESIPTRALQAALQKCLPEVGDSIPEIKLFKFGSCVNGFGSIRSDVDLVVGTSDPIHLEWFEKRFRSSESQKKLSRDFLYYLRRLIEDGETELVQHARIPVLKIQRRNVSVDITFMNTVCLHNSALLREYAIRSESTFRLVHLVKLWARNNELVSDAHNGFSLPTSYAWVLLCIFFLQVRHRCISRLCSNTPGPIQDVWGCKSCPFVDSEILKNPEPPQRSIPNSPLAVFVMFLHFLVHEVDDLVIDISESQGSRVSKDCGLCVIDPIEQDRVVTRNVSDESWSLIKTTANLFLERLELVRSFGEFLDIIDTSHEMTGGQMVGITTTSDLLDL